jgi:hypothetical protein
MGDQIALLVSNYDLPLEAELAEILPPPDDPGEFVPGFSEWLSEPADGPLKVSREGRHLGRRYADGRPCRRALSSASTRWLSATSLLVGSAMQARAWVRNSEHKSHVSGRGFEPCPGDVVPDVVVDHGQGLA